MVDLLRVPDRRAGMCNRVGLLCRELGVTVNVNNARSGGWVVCSPLGSLGAGKLYILGVAGYVTLIWDVLAPEGKREEPGEHIYSAKTNQFFFQLGNRCQLALLGLGFATALVGLGFS